VSKAFTDEEAPEAESLGRAPPRLGPLEVRYITPEGQTALRAQLEALRARLEEVLRLPESERAPRPDLERRIALVEGTLSALTVLGPDAAPEGQAAFGTFVTVRDERGRLATYRLVGPDEADPRRGFLSVHAPLGQALLGRRVGESVAVERPDGDREYELVEVRPKAP